MKAIIFNNGTSGNQQFEKIENEIFSALEKSVECFTPGAEKWAEKQYSIDKTKIALIVEVDGIRGQIISDIIKGFEVVEIQNTDPFWFSQKRLIIDI